MRCPKEKQSLRHFLAKMTPPFTQDAEIIVVFVVDELVPPRDSSLSRKMTCGGGVSFKWHTFLPDNGQIAQNQSLFFVS